MRLINEGLEKFNNWKLELSSLLSKGRDIFKQLSLSRQESDAGSMLEKVSSETFKVMVAGEFKVGKSTFINALLGADVLPSFAVPCTAVINEVKYGTEKKAVLYFKKEISILPEKLPSASRAHILKHRKLNVPPLEIPVGQLEEYIVIPEPEKDQKESVAETPYEKAVLWWPLQLCKDNVEIIDSPGLNENGTRTAITANYLPGADAVLFVVNAQAALSVTEMEFIDQNIRRAGHEYIFYIFNRFHQVVEKDRKRLMDYCVSKLAGKSRDNRYIFFVDSFDALQGKLKNNYSDVKNAGFTALESALSSFLTDKKGRIKLLHPAGKLRTDVANALKFTIPEITRLLDLDMAVFEKNLGEAEPRLRILETQKNQLRKKINNRIESFRLALEKDFRENLYDIIRQTPVWLNDARVTVKFNPFRAKGSAKKILEELIGIYQNKVEAHQNAWCDTQLNPFISRSMESIREEYSLGLDEFYLSLDNIRKKIGGAVDIDSLSEQRNVSLRERVVAALAGLMLGNAGAGLIGAGFGFDKQFLKQLAFQITAVVTMLLVGITNPVTMIPVVLAIALAGLFGGMEKVTRKLKADLANKIMEDLQQRAGNIAAEQAESIASQMEEAVDSVGLAMDKEINTVKKQMEEILEAKKQGAQKIENRKQELRVLSDELNFVNSQLNDFIKLLEMD